ncbi:RFX3 family protein [Megaselia abdita]
MATELATQQNFVRITTTLASAEGNNNSTNNGNNTILDGSTNISIVNEETDEVIAITTAEALNELTGDSNVVLVPLDSSDLSNEGLTTGSSVGDGGDVTISMTEEDCSALKDSLISQEIDVSEVVSDTATIEESDSPQFYTVTVSTHDTGGNQSAYQLQYVDTEIYQASTQSQPQLTYPFCTAVSDYQSNGQSYYSTTGNYTASTNTLSAHHTSSTSLPYISASDENILLAAPTSSRCNSPQSHHLNEVAFIQDANDSHSPQQHHHHHQQQQQQHQTILLESPETNRNLVNANRIASETVRWLSSNYEIADGVSLARSTLYSHYLSHCKDNTLEPVNPASFGKLIRSVFSNLRTRRLGTRGNSKYHYYGLRIKPSSPLMQVVCDDKSVVTGPSGSSTSFVAGCNVEHCGGIGRTNKRKMSTKENFENCLQYLGDGSNAIPVFPSIELNHSFSPELIIEDFEIFRGMYREHCESILEAIITLDFSTIELVWRDFWRSCENNNLSDEVEEEKYLTKNKLYLLCQCEGVLEFMRKIDHVFYQNIVDVLVPDVLRSVPNSLTQSVRNFAKNLEVWITEAMMGCPQIIIDMKLSSIKAFCQTLKRYTSLNHLAQAARAVLQNNTQITQMMMDLNRVDFHNVHEQASWVCQCDMSVVVKLENEFKTTLQQESPLEKWGDWMKSVVNIVLLEYKGKDSYPRAARQFLLKWSFYSSMVIRDLTLRSAASFGSFHLIRLLFDEYMIFIIEQKVAEALNKTVIGVISEKEDKLHDLNFDYGMAFINSTEMDEAGNVAKRLKID